MNMHVDTDRLSVGGILDFVYSSMSERMVSNDLEGKSLAELFEEWRTITDQHNCNESAIMGDVYGDVTNDLERRMAAAGVHSAADANAVIEFHRICYSGSEYRWEGHAEDAAWPSDKMWASMQKWLRSQTQPAA